MYRITAACACHVGRRRENNEDNFCFDGAMLPQENRGLAELLTCSRDLRTPAFFGVFDGMGGEAHGEEAAFLAARTMKERLERGAVPLPEGLLQICRDANGSICRAARKRQAGMMGSTAVLLAADRGRAYLANVGDSRAFLWRRGTLRQLSVDHTDAALLAGQGASRRKPRLTQHLGIEPAEMVIEPAALSLGLRRGDVFLLCSDGLTDMVEEREIAAVLRGTPAPAEAAEALLDRALQNGGRDNITLVLCAVRGWRWEIPRRRKSE